MDDELDDELFCVSCYRETVDERRWALGYHTCMTCGDKIAKAVNHTIAPLNKGNYMLFTDPTMLKQLNPKRTT
jgi:ribosomal protein L37AE/L43A